MLRNKILNNWRLFALIVSAQCVIVFATMTTVDLASALGVSSMIALSVRIAVPWLFVAFASSSLLALFPGDWSRWLMRNRRIFGLCFATGMGWQLFFIVWMVNAHTDYYMAEVYGLHSLVEQVPGYILLIAMTITSFRFARSKLSARQWKLLHKGGIYFLWGVVFSAYWYELNYYDDVQVIDHLYYWMGFGAWGLRMAAWTKMRVSIGETVPASGQRTS